MKALHLLKDRSSTCYSITPDQDLGEAVTLLTTHNIGALVVLVDGRLESIITERDIIYALRRHGPDAATRKVQEFMAEELVVCHTEDSLDEVMSLLFHNKTGHRIRHLPVLDDNRLVGMISIGDIVSVLLTETRFENRLLKGYIKNWPEPD